MITKPILYRLFCMAVFFSITAARAQHAYYYNVENYGADDGFRPYQTVNAITEDKRGLLWIGTDNGLYNFDGKFFRSYIHKAKVPESVPSSLVNYNYHDSKGRYWVYVYTKGLYNYLPAEAEFKKLLTVNENEFNIHQYEIGLPFEDSKNDLWFPVNAYGIARYDRNTNKFIPYKICFPGNCGEYRSSSWITKIFEDPLDGSFWLCTNKGLVHFQPGTGSSEIFYDDKFAHANTGEAPIISICSDKNKDIWLGTWSQGIKRFDRIRKTFETFLPDPKQLMGTKNICEGIAERDNNSLWVSSLDRGLLVFDKISRQFFPVIETKEFTSFKSTGNLCKSGNGTIWFSSGQKLYKLSPAENIFPFYPFSADGNHGEETGFAANFIKVGQKLYVGSYYNGSLYAYDLVLKTFRRFSLPNGNFSYDVEGLAKDHTGNIWMATNKGVFVFDVRSEKISALHATGPFAEMLTFTATAIAFDNENNAWIAGYRGLLKYNPRTKQCSLFSADQSLKNHLPTNELLTVYCDRDDNVWIGTGSHGLGCLKKGDSVLTFFNRARNKNYVQANCNSISQDANNNILYTLRGNGLFVLQHPFTEKENIVNINASNSLPTDFVNSVLVDHKKRVWVYSAAGISLLDLPNMQSTNFTRQEGLLQSSFEGNPYEDDGGNLYIGGFGGFQQFNADSFFKHPPVTAAIHFSDFRINGKAYVTRPTNIDDGHAIILNTNENNINFQFAAIATSFNYLLRYRYRLLGYEKSWVTSTRNNVTYTNLPPGDYELQINTGSINGNWNDHFFTLPIIIKKPWYRQAWFIFICFLLVSLIAFLLYRNRIRIVHEKIKLKAEYEKKLSEIEMKALRAQMNPHFIFNCLNSINRYIVKSDEKTASGYLTKFSKLIRLILDNSASENISIEKEMETLRLYIEMEALRFDHVFDFSISATDNIDRELEIPSMLIQPYVENAIWHGLLHKESGKGQLSVDFSMPDHSRLVVHIRDNGVGRGKAVELKSKDVLIHKSYGMQITKDRIDLINGLYNLSATVKIDDLADENERATGTLVIIEIPVKQ